MVHRALARVPPGRIAVWAVSLGGIALVVRSLAIGPVPVRVALVAMSAYVAMIVTGVLVPRLEMFGDVIWRGDPESRAVAFTFDDGPHPASTRRVLAALRDAGATATFFVIGRKAEAHPDLVREIVAAGHTLGVHGYDHHRLYALKPPGDVEADIRRAQTAVERACGVRPCWFRPPIGQVSPRTAEGARRAGVAIVGWSVRALDGVARAEPAAVARRVAQGLRAGAIVLLHDAAEHDDFDPASAGALPALVAAARERGLAVTGLERVLAFERVRRETPMA